MLMPTKHVSEKAELSAQFLRTLNSGLYSAPIKELLEDVTTVNELDAAHRECELNWIRSSEQMHEMRRLRKTIGMILTCYPMTPMLRIGRDGWFHSFDPPKNISHECKSDYAVLRFIHEACELGLLSRLARCGYSSCGEWFFRRVEGQKFHRAKCREAAFKSTPEWKAYRAQKAREYYWLHKRKNIK
jgi:hypothetical protein